MTDFPLKGCGSHCCVIRKPEGMGTNTTCRCPPEKVKQLVDWERARTRYNALRTEFQELAAWLEAEAQRNIPAEYTKRNLEHKYLNSDTCAGGLRDAAEEIRGILGKFS